MAFPRKLLNDNETLILDLRPHWLYLATSVAAVVAAVVLGIVVLVWDPAGVLGKVVFVAVGLIVLAALGFFGVRYALDHHELRADR